MNLNIVALSLYPVGWRFTHFSGASTKNFCLPVYLCLSFMHRYLIVQVVCIAVDPKNLVRFNFTFWCDKIFGQLSLGPTIYFKTITHSHCMHTISTMGSHFISQFDAKFSFSVTHFRSVVSIAITTHDNGPTSLSLSLSSSNRSFSFTMSRRLFGRSFGCWPLVVASIAYTHTHHCGNEFNIVVCDFALMIWFDLQQHFQHTHTQPEFDNVSFGCHRRFSIIVSVSSFSSPREYHLATDRLTFTFHSASKCQAYLVDFNKHSFSNLFSHATESTTLFCCCCALKSTSICWIKQIYLEFSKFDIKQTVISVETVKTIFQQWICSDNSNQTGH